MSDPLFTILLEGVFTRAEVEPVYEPGTNSTSLYADGSTTLATRWKTAVEKARREQREIYNSPLFRLAAVSEAPEPSPAKVHLQLGDTDYREYVLTRSDPDAAQAADPLGTAIIIVSADDQVPIVRRADRVEVNPGRYFTFGGFFDREADWDAATGKPDLFGCASREIGEELGIEVSTERLRLLAVVYDHVHPHPEACLVTSVGATSEQLAASVRSAEASELHFVPLAELATFVEAHAEDICEGLRGGLEVFSRLSTNRATDHWWE